MTEKAPQMFCISCRYREWGSYCRKCGSKLIDISNWDMKCECGKEIFPWDCYCSNCGRMITIDGIIKHLEEREAK